ncbi:hypothetical protein C8J57DRAFT_1222594 [Mycena rebaudengoi]|nr:hypothetical protein C8J57DRAFT_1222594 [Mycena rebaudengoi]
MALVFAVLCEAPDFRHPNCSQIPFKDMYIDFASPEALSHYLLQPEVLSLCKSVLLPLRNHLARIQRRYHGGSPSGKQPQWVRRFNARGPRRSLRRWSEKVESTGYSQYQGFDFCQVAHPSVVSSVLPATDCTLDDQFGRMTIEERSVDSGTVVSNTGANSDDEMEITK